MDTKKEKETINYRVLKKIKNKKFSNFKKLKLLAKKMKVREFVQNLKLKWIREAALQLVRKKELFDSQ